MSLVLPLCYLPPVSWFSLFLDQRDDVLLEQCEHFPKQTYRNRCVIYSPNGPLSLIIPVKKGSGNHTVMKDVRISYDFSWQRIHWMSLQTAYRSSAFFEFYEDEFAPFYSKKEVFLQDFTGGILQLCLRLLKKSPELRFTASYEKQEPDYRVLLNPGYSSSLPVNKEYFQVFADRHGFIPDLSIADLLFNKGPAAHEYF